MYTYLFLLLHFLNISFCPYLLLLPTLCFIYYCVALFSFFIFHYLLLCHKLRFVDTSKYKRCFGICFENIVYKIELLNQWTLISFFHWYLRIHQFVCLRHFMFLVNLPKEGQNTRKEGQHSYRTSFYRNLKYFLCLLI